jgi:hypothetical protein
MTDEERAELLRSLRKRKWCSFDDCPCERAAEEIERLAAQVRMLTHEIERLQEELHGWRTSD